MPPKTKKFDDHCAICNQHTKHLRRHTNREHMPWYMVPAYACVDCQVAGDTSDMTSFHENHFRFHGELTVAWFLLVNGFFWLICRSLGLPSIQALLDLVVAEGFNAPRPRFRDEELYFIMEYDRLAGLEPKENYSAKPPTRVSELLHLSMISHLLLKVSPEERSRLRLELNYVNIDGSSPPQGHPEVQLCVIDGHFHLDELAGRYGKTLTELEIRANSKVRLAHAVANFVYPSKWKLIPELTSVNPQVSFSLGVHPHQLLLQNVDSMFVKLCNQFQRYPSAVAVGEVGLDFTSECRCRNAHDVSACKSRKIQAQHMFLEKALKLANDLGKPVIIHCRDSGDGSAAQGVLNALISLNLTHLKVHRHCFMGSIEEFEQWSKLLPNCFFSLSLKSVDHDPTREAIMMCGHKRLLLETDSPYLSSTGDRDFHGPWRISEVARRGASLMGISTVEMLRISNGNLVRFYGLKL